MSTLTFVAQDGGNIGYLDKSTGAPVVIETYVNLLTETQMRRRLLCDIIKDALVDSKLSMNKCKQIITAIYCSGKIVSEPNIDLPPSPFDQTEIDKLRDSDYKNLLEELHDILDNDPNIKARTSELINQPKLSTVGSNTKISDAVHVFWESGFGSESIMRSPNYYNILTPAAIMDPLNKEAANAYFPPANLNIVFDKTFTKRLGFPDTMWGCFSGVVQIQYTQLINSNQVVLSHPFSINTTKADVQASQFAEYVKGNKEKNQAIATSAANLTNAANLMEIIKIIETKELGDVAQVWLYLAYLVENDLLAQREKALMITTDSVVYLFCQLLGLSCAYTGSRAGVESKNCSIYHYIAGKPDYELKIKNMVQIAYDIAEQKILTQKYIMAYVVVELDYRYMGLSRNKTLVKKLGHTDENTGKTITDERKAYFIEYFRDQYTDLETKHQKILEIKNIFDKHIDIVTNKPKNDTDVNARFQEFNAAILPYQCKIYFTKVKGQYKGFDYILQDNFRDFLYPNWKTPTAGGGLLGGSSIDKVNYMTNETSSSISKEKNYVGGIRSDIDDEITLLEATILTCSYLTLLVENKLTKSIEEEFDENEISLFAMTYDNLAYNINDIQYNELYKKIFKFNELKPLLVFNTSSETQEQTQEQIMLNDENYDENILVIGVVLSEYLYFAKNKDEEIILLEQDFMYRRQLRSNNVPVFESSTFCAGRRDINTRQIIPIQSSIDILGLCHDAKNIVEIIAHTLISANTSGRALTLGDVFVDVFDTIVRNQLERYKKVARWYFNPNYPEGFFGFCNMWNSIGSRDGKLVMRSKQILSIIRNILGYIHTYYPEIYIALLALIPQTGVNILGCLIGVNNGIIVYLRSDNQQPYFGGSNKYLLKKIKSKKNRVKKVKSKKNRAKKIKSKQHRLKKIKSKKFTRKNKKSKNGVI